MSGPWQPPAPSLAALPVDTTKTEPKPAYYKLQFGDDVTGFSYYVRTLSVVIGRSVVSVCATYRLSSDRLGPHVPTVARCQGWRRRHMSWPGIQ